MGMFSVPAGPAFGLGVPVARRLARRAEARGGTGGVAAREISLLVSETERLSDMIEPKESRWGQYLDLEEGCRKKTS